MRSILQPIIIGCVLSIFLPLTVFAQFKETPPFSSELTQGLEQIMDSTVLVAKVSIHGNKHTKKYLIERECLLKENQTVPIMELYELVDQSRKLIYNTSLFTEVEMNLSLNEEQKLDVDINVKEKWYIYILPYVQLSDRNFNEWWNTYDADINRLIYGVKMMHFNASGRRDYMTITLTSGYTRNVSVLYSAPYSNRALTEGYSLSFNYAENKETPYLTNADNKLVQYKTDHFTRKTLNVGATYQMRRGYYYKHQFGLLVNHTAVSDSVILLNPDYFKTDDSDIWYPDISYRLSYVNVDNVHYPLVGKNFYVGITKRGLKFKDEVNNVQIDGNYQQYYHLGKHWYGSWRGAMIFKAPFHQAFINRMAFGYREFYLRGLEYYAIDAPVAALGQVTLKKKVADFKIKVPFKNRIASHVPFQFYLKTYGDMGWSYALETQSAYLNNKFLYTGGFGLDILSIYDLSLRIEYSFNQLGKNGLFLHIAGGF